MKRRRNWTARAMQLVKAGVEEIYFDTKLKRLCVDERTHYGGYIKAAKQATYVLHPTKGWRRFSESRVFA